MTQVIKIVLYIIAVLALIKGWWVAMAGTTVIHEVQSEIMFLTFAVSLGLAGVIGALTGPMRMSWTGMTPRFNTEPKTNQGK